MKNLFLDEGTVQDIDKRVDRILSDLGNPTAEVQLPEVRQLLKLDLQYYSSKDDGLLKEVLHKLTIGAKQVLARPSLLADAIKTFDLKALFLPDRKRILIDSAMPDLKKRWGEGHEVLHSVLPWHADYSLGDNRTTLSPACHERIEAEANYGTGRLLFPPKPFGDLAYATAPTLEHIRKVARHFGNTITSTLWRYVENSDVCAFGSVGQHPRYPKDGEEDVSYFIRSRSFLRDFGQVTEKELFDKVRTYCSFRKAGPLGGAEAVFRDVSGQEHVFQMESFGITHAVLTLAIHVKVRTMVVPVGA
jgi:hypothetical protein